MKPLLLFTPALPLLLSGSLLAQSPTLLKDINLKLRPNPSSSPTGYSHNLAMPRNNFRFATIGPFAYFAADNGKVGRELFKSLPTPNTVTLVKDINPKGSSNPSNFTVMNNILYFSANDGKHGNEVWRSDGTAAGTFMLKDCYPGSGGGSFYYPVVMGNKLYWASYNGFSYDLWVSDGTPAGTKVFYSGLRARWYYPLAFGNKIIFRGCTKANGCEPWVTDGTKAGTKMLIDVRPGSASGSMYFPVIMGGKVYWSSGTGATYNIYVSDGTSAGTKVLYSGLRYFWYHPTLFGNKIIFRGSSPSKGYEPWITDGTAAGTRMIADLRPGTLSSFPYNFVPYKNAVYFQAYDPTGKWFFIWKTDGTAANTKVVTSKTRHFSSPILAGGNIFFRGWSASLNHGSELWKTDGTDKGTVEIKDINPGSDGSFPFYLTPVLGGSRIIFSANDGKHGKELWVSDGTAWGTKMLQDIHPGPLNNTQDSYPSYFADVSGLTYFQAYNQKTGTELYVSDGTTRGTRLVKDISPGRGSGAFLYYSRMYYWRSDGSWEPTALGNVFLFRGYSRTSGYEIFRSDGTPGGTRVLKDIYPGTGSGNFFHGCKLGRFVYFFARDRSGYGLWRTDGTPTGTVKVKGGFYSYWFFPFPYKNKILFTGYRSSSGREPWVTDGTAAGTMMLKDIRPGRGSGFFYDPVIMGGKVYFRASKATGRGYDLWVTDGTPAGTKLAATLNGYSGYDLTALGNKLFFRGHGPSTGYEIWVSDGTQAGTKMFKDIWPGSSSGNFYNPCVQGNTLFFRASNGTNGYELWKTDGTPAGTVMVKDIRPGPGSSTPLYISRLGSRLVVFQANDGVSGIEPWISDGTPAGTRRAGDICPGRGNSSPSEFVLSGGRLFFRANNGSLGYEPWVWFPGATAQAYGFGTGSQPKFISTDPVLGKTMTWTLVGVPKGKVALALLCAPTHAPTWLGGGWIYFDLKRIFAGFAMIPKGVSGTATLKISVPNSPALTGFSLASQAFMGPTATPPIGIDFSNGQLLTFGN